MTVTAPDSRWRTIIKTGQSTYEMTGDYSSSSPEGTSSKDHEWLDRSPLPSKGSEVPVTVKVTIESGEDETSEGSTTISLRNPNNYRS